MMYIHTYIVYTNEWAGVNLTFNATTTIKQYPGYILSTQWHCKRFVQHLVVLVIVTLNIFVCISSLLNFKITVHFHLFLQHKGYKLSFLIIKGTQLISTA